MSMKGLDGYFPNMQFELSSVSLSVHRSARSGTWSRELHCQQSQSWRPFLRPWPVLGCALCAAPGIWCTAPPCCCCTSCALACSRPTHSVTTPPPWLAGGAGEGGGNRFSSLFAEKQPVLKIICAGHTCRKGTCFVQLYLCRPKVQRVEA